jgi:hypothetical protein
MDQMTVAEKDHLWYTKEDYQMVGLVKKEMPVLLTTPLESTAIVTQTIVTIATMPESVSGIGLTDGMPSLFLGTNG